MRHAFLYSCLAGLGFVSMLLGCELVRTPEECDADLEAMQQAVTDAVASGLSCQLDSDCIVMDVSNGCFGACPVSVGRDHYSTVISQVEDADRTYCKNYADQCGYSIPLCVEATAACIQGRCQLVDPLENL